MILAMGDPKDVIKQRIGFWNNVYGFDMSVMAAGVHDEAIVDYVSKDEVLSTQCIVKVSFNVLHSYAIDFPFGIEFTFQVQTRE
jgi:protein arginine N-methyltransferase 3